MFGVRNSQIRRCKIEDGAILCTGCNCSSSIYKVLIDNEEIEHTDVLDGTTMLITVDSSHNNKYVDIVHIFTC